MVDGCPRRNCIGIILGGFNRAVAAALDYAAQQMHCWGVVGWQVAKGMLGPLLGSCC